MKWYFLSKSSLWKFCDSFWDIHFTFRIPFIWWASLKHKFSYFPKSSFTFCVFILLILLFWSMNRYDSCCLKTCLTSMNYHINVFFMKRRCCWGRKRITCWTRLLLTAIRSNGQGYCKCFLKNHGIIKYPELKSTHKNHQSPTQLLALHRTRITPSKHFLNSDSLGASSNFWYFEMVFQSVFAFFI